MFGKSICKSGSTLSKSWKKTYYHCITALQLLKYLIVFFTVNSKLIIICCKIYPVIHFEHQDLNYQIVYSTLLFI